jgi:GNAT superfamily N-acetyltransferase
MSEGIRYRLYEPSDRENLLALFRAVYGDDAPRKTSSWRYLDRPLRRALISVAEADGHIVGTQPSYEVLVQTRGGPISGAMFLDVMTHPAYRGRGIFKGVVEHLRRECHERGMAILLTTPNADAARGFAKLAAWHCLGELTPYVRPVALSRLLRPGSRARTPAATRAHPTVAEMDTLDRPIAEVWRRFAEAAPTMLARDTDYITWRFSNRGPRRYRLFAAGEVRASCSDGGSSSFPNCSRLKATCPAHGGSSTRSPNTPGRRGPGRSWPTTRQPRPSPSSSEAPDSGR